MQTHQKKAEVVVLISDKTDFKTKAGKGLGAGGEGDDRG